MIKKFLFISIITSIVFSSCSEYQKVLKSNDRVYKYEKAVEYYENEEWHKAATVMEDILPLYRGTEKGGELLYKYSFCHYNVRDYILAGYYFRKYSETYGNSNLAEEATFRSAECYALDSPRSSLDQSSTKSAISEFELFMIKFPKSEFVKEAREYVENLNDRLAEKEYNNAKLYYDLGYYKSAVTALNNCLTTFPYTKKREDILFFVIKSHYLYAKNSIFEKQQERFKEVSKSYKKFQSEFPESNYIKEAKKMFDVAEKRMEEIASGNSNS